MGALPVLAPDGRYKFGKTYRFDTDLEVTIGGHAFRISAVVLQLNAQCC